MKKLIAANWKMNKTIEESVFSVRELKKLVRYPKNAEVVICPSFTSLEAVGKELRKSGIKLGAQNMHFEDFGAYTGDVSPSMLKDAGCEYVILGHSERREFFKEDDEIINKKVMAALNHSLIPILCVGENFGQRNGGNAKEAVGSQLRNCLRSVSKAQIEKIDIAYEPVWAISRGNPNVKPATKEDAEEMHSFIREVLKSMFDGKIAENARVIYGGSVKPENAKDILSMPNVNGALVGNASLNAKSFAEIVKAA